MNNENGLKRNVSNTTQTTAGVSNSGYEYERLIAAYLALRVLLDPNVNLFDFELNSSSFKKFDDLIINIVYKDKKKEQFLIQLKHREKEKSFLEAKKEFLRTDNNGKPKPFNILQYVEAYNKNRGNCQDNRKFILFTNVTFLNVENVQGFQTTKPENFFKLDVFNGNNVLQFQKVENKKVNCKNFYLIHGQKNVKEVKQEIMAIFKNQFYAEDPEAEKFINFVRNVHNNDFIDTKLSRDAVILNLSKILFASWTLKPQISRNVDPNIILFEKAVKEFDLTILKEAREWKFIIENDLAQFTEKAQKLKFITKEKNCSENIPEEFLCFLLEKPLFLKISNDQQVKTIHSILPLIKTLTEHEAHFVFIGENLNNSFKNFNVFENLGNLKTSKLYTEFQGIIKVSLQGRESKTLQRLQGEFGVSFDELISTDEILNSLNSVLFVGKQLPKLPRVYIPRKLQKLKITIDDLKSIYRSNTTIVHCGGASREFQQFLLEKNLEIRSVCTSVEKFRKNNFNSEPILVLTDEEFFENEEDYGAENFLYLKLSEGHNLEWCEREILAKNPVIFKNNVNLLIGDSGSGKTTMMKYLAQNCPLNYWVVFISLDEFCSDITNCVNETELEKLFQQTTANDFDNKILNHFREKKNIVFLFDGINRLNGDSKEKAMKSIKLLTENLFKVWISCRNNLLNFVKSHLNMSLLYQVDVFRNQDQEELIRQTVNQSDADEIVEKFIKNDSIKFKDILKNPLMLNLVAETPNILKNFSNFEICKFYNNFFEKKIEHNFKKKGIEEGVLEKLQIVIDFFKYYYFKGYQIQGLQCCLETRIFELLNVKPDAKFLEIMQDNDFLGIIKINQDKKSFFEPHSFAEYSAAMWLVENVHHVPASEKHFIFQNEYEGLRRFFDSKLAKDCLLHLAVLNQNLADVKKFADLRHEKDKGGRTALHLAASLGQNHKILNKAETKLSSYKNNQQSISQQQEIFDYLLGLDSDPFQKDELFKWNVFEYADASLCLYSLEKLVQKLEKKQQIWNYLKTFSNHLHTLTFYCVTLGYKSLLEIAMEVENLEELSKLHKEKPLLHLALENNQLEIVKMLINNGFDLSTIDIQENTALHKAATWGHKEIVELLLQKKLNVEAKNKMGKTPLHLAARMGHEAIMKTLLDHGANIDAVDNEGKTALHTAAFLGRTNIVQFLHASGCNLNCINNNEKTALHRATKMGHLDTVTYLIENGLNVEAVDRFKSTALHYAASEGRQEIVQYLLLKQANVFAKNENNKTAKQLARKMDFMNIVDILQKAEDKCAIRTADNYIVHNLHEAAEEGDLEYIQKQLEEVEETDKNKILEKQNEDLDTLLHIASCRGHLNIVKFLLTQNVSTSIKNRDGRIPLHLASYYGHTEIVKELIPKSNVSAVDKWGVTPLHRAIYNGHTENVKSLLNAGADVNCVTFDGTTPLHSTALGGHLELLKVLLKENADIKKKTNRGSTCLHIAVGRRYLDVVKYLVETKKEILNDVDVLGRTSLYIAAHQGCKDVIDILVAGKADVNQKNEYGETALDAALNAGRKEIVDYLKQFVQL